MVTHLASRKLRLRTPQRAHDPVFKRANKYRLRLRHAAVLSRTHPLALEREAGKKPDRVTEPRARSWSKQEREPQGMAEPARTRSSLPKHQGATKQSCCTRGTQSRTTRSLPRPPRNASPYRIRKWRRPQFVVRPEPASHTWQSKAPSRPR